MWLPVCGIIRRQLTMCGVSHNVSRLDGKMIGSRQHSLKPVLRICAAVSLLVWLAAVIACSADCAGDSYCKSSAAMVQTAATSGQSHDSDKHDRHDDSLCVSLHSVCPASPNAILVKPDFGLAFTLDFISAAPLVALTRPEAVISRQPPDCHLVFTPEVCLGPAFHSLAPPAVA